MIACEGKIACPVWCKLSTKRDGADNDDVVVMSGAKN